MGITPNESSGHPHMQGKVIAQEYSSSTLFAELIASKKAAFRETYDSLPSCVG